MAGRKVDLEVAFRDSAAARPRRQNPVITDAGTVGITLHAAREVRDQLRDLAYERRMTMLLLCVALNDLFAAHHRPEIAAVIPRKPKARRPRSLVGRPVYAGPTVSELPTSIHRVSVATGPRRPPGRDP